MQHHSQKFSDQQLLVQGLLIFFISETQYMFPEGFNKRALATPGRPVIPMRIVSGRLLSARLMALARITRSPEAIPEAYSSVVRRCFKGYIYDLNV